MTQLGDEREAVLTHQLEAEQKRFSTAEPGSTVQPERTRRTFLVLILCCQLSFRANLTLIRQQIAQAVRVIPNAIEQVIVIAVEEYSRLAV